MTLMYLYFTVFAIIFTQIITRRTRHISEEMFWSIAYSQEKNWRWWVILWWVSNLLGPLIGVRNFGNLHVHGKNSIGKFTGFSVVEGNNVEVAFTSYVYTVTTAIERCIVVMATVIIYGFLLRYLYNIIPDSFFHEVIRSVF